MLFNVAMRIEGRKFILIGVVKPVREPDGSIWTHEPQKRYAKAATSKLHAFGDGAFCKFVLDGASQAKGVYLVTCRNEVQYVGETVALKGRFNAGYGNISPRNCYAGGQPTNCRVNKLILGLLQQEEEVKVLFCPCEDHVQLERKLKARLVPPWNR